jgi:hypothetical protein
MEHPKDGGETLVIIELSDKVVFALEQKSSECCGLQSSASVSLLEGSTSRGHYSLGDTTMSQKTFF